MIKINALSSLLLSLVLALFSTSVLAQEELDTPVNNSVASNSVTVSAMEQQQGSAKTISTSTVTGGSGGIPALTMTTNPDGSEDYSINLQILALMTMLGFLPAMVILMTSFTRIVVVMSILRQAMGLQPVSYTHLTLPTNREV